ncbi:4-(cytidine 5'-diphospho)-2-C-methyl-D-erythritol kinase [Magnetospira sp. QH-2]|uniref:4-(cytidine 5'-diphospho)-2-C-methyl-D-erythritol kinase n=1 Tax=Magnetospira sp. (strain QH-2) TaxID=1288970 RepID=UPI0003E80FAD|nr:4-(cytidine 5'-diphospho)-2-C-methyl-D-erythritol kinase [Magnetospira sp. QH-2]CCQ75323.1 4-diphosphocytidyl-2-C-methyl-D-erythritol kinase [Magnetospira sp. QH-2]
MPSVHAGAPAKLNLTLQVTGKRDDGYHLLHSLVAFAAVGDRISARPGDGLTLTLTGPGAAALNAEDDNLVTRAALRLAERLGRAPDVALTLHKVLPVASGIGGGSADAAATLRVLRDLWSVDLSEPDWAELALELGADVPVCLSGQPMVMSGIGEILSPAPPLPRVWVVLVNPGLALSTPAVFKARAAPFSTPSSLPEIFHDGAELADHLQVCGNDLETPAMTLAPVIGEILECLSRNACCLMARMSGSGATCFGLYGTADEAQAAALAARVHRPDWWVAAARLLEPGETFDGDLT